jgi:hypothetical protein
MSGLDQQQWARNLRLGLTVAWLLGLNGCTSTLHYLHRHTPVGWAGDCQTPYYQCSQCGRLIDRSVPHGCCEPPPAPFYGFSTTYWTVPACDFVPQEPQLAPLPSDYVPEPTATPAAIPDMPSGPVTDAPPDVQRLPAVAVRRPAGTAQLPRR